MKGDLHRLASELFLQARELPAPLRAPFLEEKCGGDDELLREVHSLLEHASETEGFLESSALGEDFRIRDALLGGAPEAADDLGAIGPYRLIERIGAGGFGIVYLAEQEEPVRRRVALKLIKPGMDTEEVVARFAAEREALSRMDHPNVATVFDAGVTDEGRPYFVMEYVPGDSITCFCDRAKLDVRARLELFITVCEAVQHAHQKGILHRDLKPSNVLVRLVDGVPSPRVIDFGVAKALNEPLTAHDVHTGRENIVGTPAYMSPEQAESSGVDVDTRTDIYSLGILLYELLSGSLPIGRARGGRDDLMRAAILEEAPSPSKQVKSEQDEDSARQRGSSVERLAREVAGDLDWITLKAIERDRLRRYPSASELAADLRRYLADEAVSAGPPSSTYRLRKFVTRNRVSVAAGALVLLALVVGFVGVSLAMWRAKEDRDRARTAEALAAERLVEIEAAAARSEAVTSFLRAMWSFATPEEATGGELSAPDLLDRASRMLDRDLDREPEIRVVLHSTLGRIYMQLARYGDAEREFRAALLISGAQPAQEVALQSTLLHNLSRALTEQAKWNEAAPLIRESLALRLALYGEDSPEILASYDSLATLLNHQGETLEAEVYCRRAYDLSAKIHGPTDEKTLVFANNLGVMLRDQGEYAEAEPLFRLVYEARLAEKGTNHTSVVAILSNLAALWGALGQHEKAVEAFTTVLESHRSVYGADRLPTAIALSNLATQYIQLEDHERAIPMLRDALRIMAFELGEKHPTTISTCNNLARALLDAGLYDEGLECAERAVRLSTLHTPETHRLRGFTRSILGEILCRLERLEEAEEVLIEAYDLLAETRGVDMPGTRTTAQRLTEVYEAMGDDARAQEWKMKAE